MVNWRRAVLWGLAGLSMAAQAETMRLSCAGQVTLFVDGRPRQFSNESVQVMVDTLTRQGSVTNYQCLTASVAEDGCGNPLNFTITDDTFSATYEASNANDAAASKFDINRYNGQLKITEMLVNKRGNARFQNVTKNGVLECTKTTAQPRRF